MRLIFDPKSATVRTAGEIVARHQGSANTPCRCCQTTWPCQPLRNATAVCLAAGLRMASSRAPAAPPLLPQDRYIRSHRRGATQ